MRSGGGQKEHWIKVIGMSRLGRIEGYNLDTYYTEAPGLWKMKLAELRALAGQETAKDRAAGLLKPGY